MITTHYNDYIKSRRVTNDHADHQIHREPPEDDDRHIQFDDNDDAKRQWNTALDNGHVLIADVNDIPVAIKEIVSLENGTVTFKHGRITKSDINIVALCIKVNGYISIQGPYGEMRYADSRSPTAPTDSRREHGFLTIGEELAAILGGVSPPISRRSQRLLGCS